MINPNRKGNLMEQTFTDKIIHMPGRYWAMIMIAIFMLFAADSCDNGGTHADETATDRQLSQYQKVQPIPFHDRSQYRETLISIDEAQARGTATTTFFFEAGIQNPVRTCDSIGYAVPSTAQLT